MLRSRRKGVLLLTGVLSLFLFSCLLEEELVIHSDGSGTFRAKVTIPKEFGEGFADIRKDAEKEGFQIEEGETEKERFIILRKKFDNVSALNDDGRRFELTMADSGFLRRQYLLRVQLPPVGFGGFTHRLVVTMPGKVQSATGGEFAGSRVTWEGKSGGTIEITAAGFYLPVSRTQRLLFLLVVVAGIVALLILRKRRQGQPPAATTCLTCQTPLSVNARFCRACGAVAPIPET